MKKIFSSLILVICLVIATIGIGGCSSCSSGNNSENGGQTEVNKITTLEGVWESKHGREGEHEKIVVEGTSIRCYTHEGINYSYKLEWAGVYIPFTEPITEGKWVFVEDIEYYKQHEEEWGANGHGIPTTPNTRIFNYSNKKLSCNMSSALGGFYDITFTKVSD